MTSTKKQLLVAERAALGAFRNGGCVRKPRDERRDEGHRSYKKGWEVRFYADSEEDASRICKVLADSGLRPGRPYEKRARRWIVPLYGRDAVAKLLSWDELLT